MSNQEIYEVLDSVLLAAKSAKARADRIIHRDQLSGDFESEAFFDAICMNFVVIGEKLKTLDNKTQGQYLKKYTDIPWAEVIRMRDVVAHHYTGIKSEVIFETVKRDIPDLISTLKVMMEDLKEDI